MEAQPYKTSNVWSDRQGTFPGGIWYFRYFKGSPTGIFSDTLTPVADTYVDQDAPTSNFGSATDIHVKGLEVTPCRYCAPRSVIPIQKGLLKFDASEFEPLVNAPLIYAKLRLCALDTSVEGGDIAVTQDASWDENAVIWPGPGANGEGSVSVGPVIAGQCYEVDVTDLMWNGWWDGQSVYSFVVSAQTPIEVKYGSKEARIDLQPRLFVCTTNVEWC